MSENSFQNISNFSDEYALIRYFNLILSSNIQHRKLGFSKIIPLAKKLNFMEFLKETLTNFQADPEIYDRNLIPKDFQEKYDECNKTIDIYDKYFLSIDSKNLKSESVKVKEYSKRYYEFGCFSKYITVFSRYISNIKNDFPEPELHQYIVRYVISCILKRQYDLAISELSKLKHIYHLYDISIYVL